MTRRYFIEQVLRQVYGGQPNDDAAITEGLVNSYLNEAIGFVARKNYTDNYTLDGVAYLNNSFYTTYKNLDITQEENYLFKFTLPQLPVGVGRNEGVASVQLKDGQDSSKEVVILSMNEVSYLTSARPIQNRIVGWNEGDVFYLKSTIPLYDYTAKVRVVSGGDSADLDSKINVPDDYIPQIREYVVKQLIFERGQKKDAANDGTDIA